jgi:monoamine oxidase
MAHHSRLFGDVARMLRLGLSFERRGISTREGLERVDEAAYQARRSRRDLLRGAAGLALGAGVASLSRPAAAKSKTSSARIAIVGGGLGGLVCADELQRAGVIAALYEGSPERLGGRCHSIRDVFPGQVAEAGGEMIDNAGKTMIGYAREFGLTLEDYLKEPGETTFWFQGRKHARDEVVDQFRAFVARAKPDLQTLSAAPSYFTHTDADVAFDNLDLAAYLDSRAAGLPLIRWLLDVAYVSEYGLECHDLSCLNMLLFIHLDRRKKWNPYGSSDERYHIVEGNDAVVSHLAARQAGPLHMMSFLQRLSRNSAGEYVLELRGQAAPAIADAVVLAIPFSALRNVTLDASLGLPPAKLRAIQELGYGYNGKTILGFDGRPWARYGANGSVYADTANLQNTWETSWTRAGATSVLTDFFGGDRGLALQTLGQASRYCGNCHGPGSPFTGGTFFDMNETIIDQQADAMLTDFDKVFPGAKAAVSKNPDGSPVLYRAHWFPQPFARGCYTAYKPGQFTQICGLESVPVDGLYFAGEHADSFYDWQGFLEGACRSGVAAADTILSDMASGLL